VVTSRLKRATDAQPLSTPRWCRLRDGGMARDSEATENEHWDRRAAGTDRLWTVEDVRDTLADVIDEAWVLPPPDSLPG
jgi:hypothetical protein